MIQAAVLGSPISHSLSPLLHNRAYELLNIEGKYSAIEVRNGELKSFLQSQIEIGWTGFSLTMPLKEEVLGMGFPIDEIALHSRSANTLIADGKSFRALSTDFLAFKRLLELPRSARVAVIGAGGTARSALAALAEKVPQVDIFLRDPAKATALGGVAPNLGIHALSFADLNPTKFSQYDWVISTVPAGATDDFALALSKEDIRLESVHLLEVLYNPWPTELLISAGAAGAKTIDGLVLLVEQALHQIQIFTQRDFDFTAMRTELLRIGLAHLNT